MNESIENAELIDSKPETVETVEAVKTVEIIEKDIDTDTHDTVEMSVTVSADEYAILTNEFTIFGTETNDAFLRKLILGREAVLKAEKALTLTPSVSEPVEAKDDNVELKETAKIIEHIVKAKTDQPKQNNGLIIFVVILVIAVILGLIWWAMAKRKNAKLNLGELDI